MLRVLKYNCPFYEGIIYLVRTQNLPKNQRFSPPDMHTCEYQGVRNASFSENLEHALNELSPELRANAACYPTAIIDSFHKDFRNLYMFSKATKYNCLQMF